MIFELLKSYSGILIVLCFTTLIVLTIKHENKKIAQFNKKTITQISASNQLINITRLLCLIVAILIPIFVGSLINQFNLNYKAILYLFSYISSFALVTTSLSLKKSDSPIHLLPAGTFFTLMVLIELIVSLSIIKQLPFMGFTTTGLVLLNIILVVLAQRDRYFSGKEEIILMSGSALWVIIFSLLPIVPL